MGSAIGGLASIWQYRKQSKAMKQAEAEQAAEKARAEALTPAEAENADDAGVIEDMLKKRKGVQATMVASKGKSKESLG